nr:hypothetical protein [Candidatus Freyarchaeota archaeon]
MKTTPTEKDNPKTKTQTETEKEKEKMEELENLYTFRAGASCGLYSMGEEFWENLGEKINPAPEKEKEKKQNP